MNTIKTLSLAEVVEKINTNEAYKLPHVNLQISRENMVNITNGVELLYRCKIIQFVPANLTQEGVAFILIRQ